MSDNPLTQLSALGQSVWLDLIRRNMLTPGGEMQKLIENDGVRGVTSNPAIFEKAINGSTRRSRSTTSAARRTSSVRSMTRPRAATAS
jgi:transaldolase